MMPFIQAGPFAPEISGMDSENYLEVECDDIVLMVVGVVISELFLLKNRPMDLGFKSISLSPVSPPPNPA